MLALKYRPKKFSDVLGQPHVCSVLKASVASEEVFASYVFAGSHGTGKTSVARIFAAALNCSSSENGDACGECDSCEAVSTGASASVLEVDAASTGGVADVERIREVCRHIPPGQYRVVILDEAHSMSREAFNALLKMLEEPPANTVFVLVTTEPGKILKTVRSRSLPFQFRSLPIPDVAQALWDVSSKEGFQVSPELCIELATRTRGHMRDALMVLDQCRLAEVGTADDYVEMFTTPDASWKVLTSLAHGDFPQALSAATDFLTLSADPSTFVDSLIDSLVEVMAAAAGSERSSEQSRRLAAMWDKRQMFDALTSLWEFSDRQRVSADPRTQVRLILSRLAVDFDVDIVASKTSVESAMRSVGLLG